MNFMFAIFALILGCIIEGMIAYLLGLVLPKRPNFPQFLKIIVVLFLSIVLFFMMSHLFGESSLSNDHINYGSIFQNPSKPPECDFIYEIQQKGEIIVWIDTPIGSGQWSGVQVRALSSLTIPEGWIAHIGNTNDQLGPLTLSKGTVASIYAPYKCRPIKKP